MTYPAPDVVPYDEWFDPNYKYYPDEEMDLAPSSVEPQDEEETMHEKASDGRYSDRYSNRGSD